MTFISILIWQNWNSDISEAEVESENSDDESTDDFDTEWNEFQNLVSLTEEKFRAFWQDEHFRKAFKKFKNKFSKLRNTNQNTVIRQFHDFATVSQAGRQNKEVARRTEMFITDTEENTWHSLPARKRPRLQLEHSLDQAVTNN